MKSEAITTPEPAELYGKAGGGVNDATGTSEFEQSSASATIVNYLVKSIALDPAAIG